MRPILLTLSIIILSLCSTDLFPSESSIKYIQGSDTLVVYKDVPGLPPSEFYTVRVRSAATLHQWVECFANITRNLSRYVTPFVDNSRVGAYYHQNTVNWSQTYINIETSRNSAVEVEIAPKNGFQIYGRDFYKAAVHPSQDADTATINGGKVYFKLYHPGSFTVDINGEMDDYQPKSLVPLFDITDPTRIVHNMTVFANPILSKPSLDDPNIVFAEPGVMPSSNLGDKSILYFKPGVHNVGLGFKLSPGKSYYIPGDAIVYGTLNNIGVPASGSLAAGENIKIYGLGTLSGDSLNHPICNFPLNAVLTTDQTAPYKSIDIEDATNVLIEGIFVANNCFHGIHMPGADNNTCRWVKVVSWRTNGDGIGDASLTEDCFIRTGDDCAYIKGDKRRCKFWKDSNAAVFHLTSTVSDRPIIIEDCDVLYLRSKINQSWGDGVFVERTEGPIGVQHVNVLVKDFRILDPHPNVPVFNLGSFYEEFVNKPSSRFSGVGSSFYGFTFQNVSAVAVYKGFANGKSERITGHATAPWYGGIVFDSCTIAARKLSIDDFLTNAYVSDILFDKPRNLTLTTSSIESEGIVTRNLLQDTYLEASPVILTAVAKPGYLFSGWSGDASGTKNPLTVMIRGNMNITANFQPANLNDPIVIDAPSSGTWMVPQGVESAIFQVWGAGGAGGSAYCGTATTNTQSRAGGGSGGSFASVTKKLTPGQILNYTVGAGGMGAAQGFTHQSIGQAGGSSYLVLNDTTFVLAQGGLGGENSSVTNLIYNGSGGLAQSAACIGDLIYTGGNGGAASSIVTGYLTGSGGGGGSAGIQGAGGNGTSISAGTAGLGGGASGGTGTNLYATLPTDGDSPGGGGAGAIVRNSSPYSNSNVFQKGASGGNGKLIILLNQSTGITKAIRENGFLIFPNPVKLVLSWNTNEDPNQIKIYSVNGVLLFESSDINSGSVNLAFLPKGLYLCQFMKGKQLIYVGKIIKE